MKRILSLLMCLCLVLSLGAAAYASGEAELAEGQADEYTQAVIAASSGSTGGTVYGTVTAEVTDEVQAAVDEANVAVSGGTTTFPDAYPEEAVYNISDEELEEVLDALIATMTFDEKIYMISMNTDPENRSGVGYITGVPRLGVPEMRLHDGPAGISMDVETTNPPNQLLSSCSWSTDVAYEFGEIYGLEHWSTGSGWQLGTQMDVARNQFWARDKDTWGEDYYLTSRLAVAQTEGVQENGGIPMAKHIGAYNTDGDTQLMLVVDEQTFHTAYLYPFEAAAKEASLASIMGTYNRIQVVDEVDPSEEFEGYYVSSNSYLQVETLRGMWNWEGAMCPDWGANKEFSLSLGTDLFQDNFDSVKNNVLTYMSAGIVDMDMVNDAARRVLYAYGVSGFLNLVEIDPETGLCLEETGRTEPVRNERTWEQDVEDGLYDYTNSLALDIAEKSIVLLKNENDALPLTTEDYSGDNSVAIIGYGSVNAMGGTGGERSKGFVKYFSSIYDSVVDIVGDGANVEAYKLNDVHGDAIPSEYLFTDETMTQNGLVRTYGILPEDNVSSSSSSSASGESAEPASAESVDYEGYETGSFASYDANLDLYTYNGYRNAENGEGIEPGEVYTWHGYIQAPETGTYQIVLQSVGGTARVDVNGTASQLSGTMDWDYYTTDGCKYTTVNVDMTEGELYEVTVTVNNNTDYYTMPVHLCWITPSMPEQQEAAAQAAAADSSTVIYVTRTGATGHGPVSVTDWDISLDEKDEIAELAAIARENGNKFIVIVYSRSGYSFEGDWLDNTDALLSVFYPGQAGSQAIAEILTGEVNPSGKLTMTLPKVSTDTLMTIDDETNVIRAGEQTQQGDYIAYYTEGLEFGYRWYDAEDIEPEFAFGHGLSYSTFEYGDYEITAAAEDGETYGLDITMTVTNTSDVTGSEIVQVYIGPASGMADTIQTVEKQLCAFARVEDLAPGETRQITMHVSERMLSYWDTAAELHENEDGTMDKFFVPEGEREIMIGAASDDIVYTQTVDIIPA